jgi:uroporphyrinogen III methyltransferase / synthase
VGPATTAKVERYGIRVDVMPAEHHAEGVLAALTAAGEITGKRVLFPRSDIAREVIGDELRRAGAEVAEVVAYRTTTASLERESDHDIYRMLLERQIDAVTFTSASTVRNFVQIIGEDQAVDLLNMTVVACIGPVTAEAAQQLGISTAVMPERYTVPDLVDALVEHFRTKGIES